VKVLRRHCRSSWSSKLKCLVYIVKSQPLQRWSLLERWKLLFKMWTWLSQVVISAITFYFSGRWWTYKYQVLCFWSHFLLCHLMSTARLSHETSRRPWHIPNFKAAFNIAFLEDSASARTACWFYYFSGRSRSCLTFGCEKKRILGTWWLLRWSCLLVEWMQDELLEIRIRREGWLVSLRLRGRDVHHGLLWSLT
jgi:hypothetical protein